MNSFLKNNFISISFGTSLSKLIGLIRQIFIAAAFGVGLTYDAFNYAYIIPGFFIIIISGINGPLHNAIVAIVTPLKANKAGLVLSRVSIKLTLVFSLIALIIYAKATYLIGIIGPDLNLETKLSAIRQLKIIAPCIPLSAFIGLSFGALNSRNKFLISSLSPSIVSFSIILFITLNWVFNLENKFESGFLGTNLLALATLIGTFLQFVIQLIETYRIDILRFNRELFKFSKEEKRIFKLIIPTTLSSGVGQINVFVDMFFVSSFPGAASSLAYGNLLIQAPLGILSNSLILPLLPKLSYLINKEAYIEFKKALIKGIEYCFLTTFFLSGFFILFNKHIVELIFQRGAFNYEASLSVEKILIAYAIGIPFYLFRDLIVRSYYILEKTKLPLKLSCAGIVLNVFFDWALLGGPIKDGLKLFSFNYGVIGVVLSSGVVNFIISIVLLIKFKAKKTLLPLYYLGKKLILIFISCLISTIICQFIFTIIFQFSKGTSYSSLNLFVGFPIYLLVYFLITKILKVNNIELKSLFSSNSFK